QITAQTYKLVEPAFEFKPLGGIQVKGKSEPVVAYRVLRPRSSSGRAPRADGQAGESPLVGREDELRSIASRIERLTEAGEGGVIGIIGEAGLPDDADDAPFTGLGEALDARRDRPQLVFAADQRRLPGLTVRARRTARR